METRHVTISIFSKSTISISIFDIEVWISKASISISIFRFDIDMSSISIYLKNVDILISISIFSSISTCRKFLRDIHISGI